MHGDNIQPWCTPFPIWNQSVVPYPVLTVASWPAYRFLKRQVRAAWNQGHESLVLFMWKISSVWLLQQKVYKVPEIGWKSERELGAVRSPLLCKTEGFLGGSVVKNPPAKQATRAPSLCWEDPLEMEMATHSSILTWEIPWTEEPAGCKRVHGVTKESSMI